MATNAFNKAVEAANLEEFRFHGLRHTAGSYLVMRGASLAGVKAILGLSDVKMIMRYAYLSLSTCALPSPGWTVLRQP